ncbi:MAG: alpha/beta fold hydrolase [Marinobacter sp.]|uniref:alpha/beta fold hydrolase n=1 Tax=Marinobacter sp. TaxID=50741 RepID=UPI00299F2F22|nr:alpha/beta fold hydrolase [Marinobacter sp.]MDX1757117.1 alpha/beta fold hydrolase [Marinobacter sp.]
MPTIDRGSQRLYFEVTGQGPAIVLGHSFLCSGAMWEPQIEALSAHHRVINVDLRGHGQSGPVDGAFDLYDLVDDVLAVLDHLQVNKAIWAGLSIGGMVAIRAALRNPDRVAGLILLDTHAGAETWPNRAKNLVMTALARRVGVVRLAPVIAQMFFCGHSRKHRATMVQAWRDRFAAVPLETALRGAEALKRRDSVVGQLADIRVPALVMVGERDEPLPPRCAEQLATGIPDSSLLIIAEAGHLSTLEQPETVTSAMLAYLRSIGAGGESERDHGG